MSYLAKRKQCAKSGRYVTVFRMRCGMMFIINIFLCGLARAAINIRPLPRLMPYFGYFQKTLIVSTILTNQQYHRARLIGSSVRLAAKYTAWDSSCLTQAMVATFWCRRFRIPYVLYIGFAKSTDEPSGYKAHAWVSAGPVAVTGGQGFADFHVVSSYAHRDLRNV